MIRKMSQIWYTRIMVNNVILANSPEGVIGFNDFFDIYYDKTSKMFSIMDLKDSAEKVEYLRRKRAAIVLQKWVSNKLSPWYKLMKTVFELKSKD